MIALIYPALNEDNRVVDPEEGDRDGITWRRCQYLCVVSGIIRGIIRTGTSTKNLAKSQVLGTRRGGISQVDKKIKWY